MIIKIIKFSNCFNLFNTSLFVNLYGQKHIYCVNWLNLKLLIDYSSNDNLRSHNKYYRYSNDNYRTSARRGDTTTTATTAAVQQLRQQRKLWQQRQL